MHQNPTPDLLPLAPPPSPLARLLRSEMFPGLLLVFAAAVSITLANLPMAAAWREVWETHLRLQLGDWILEKPVQHWINDGLMVVFFFFVGLEIKHEMLDGELQSARKAALPIAAALGGMLVPAGLYAAVAGWRGDGAAAGWGIPMATDIAFALGVLVLLGRRVPTGLKVFLASLAIVDDLGAVLVIAIFYTEQIEWQFLLAGLGILAVSYGANRCGVRKTWPYTVLGLLLWLLFLKSGVHATIAGVALAMTVPARRELDEQLFSARARQLLDGFDHAADRTPLTNPTQLRMVRELQMHATAVQAPLQRMEHGLSPLVSHLIVPLFALANAGVGFADGFDAAAPAAQGVFVGLCVGKPVGVMLACWLAVRWLGSPLPASTTWRHVHGAAWLSGIGFTMSLFVNGLAFPDRGPSFTAAKVAVLGASVVCGIVGYLLLRTTPGADRTDA
ncbi:MAG: Na+/H+ antiporter NhaA [Planctomycetota bacterium]